MINEELLKKMQDADWATYDDGENFDKEVFLGDADFFNASLTLIATTVMGIDQYRGTFSFYEYGVELEIEIDPGEILSGAFEEMERRIKEIKDRWESGEFAIYITISADYVDELDEKIFKLMLDHWLPVGPMVFGRSGVVYQRMGLKKYEKKE